MQEKDKSINLTKKDFNEGEKKYIASCSFGKDSVATVILAKENNEPLDEIVYCEVMYDETISGELPEHRDFIYNVAIPQFKEWGYKVTIVRSHHTFYELFHRITKRSKVESRNGKERGFPLSMGCYMNSAAKVTPIRQYWRNKKENVIQYVGIAIDEPKRLERVHNSNNQISLLEKYGYTEEMAYKKCVEYGLLSPIYDFTDRGGCWFCPNQKKPELKHLRDNHKDLWDKLLELSKKDLANPYFNAFKKVTMEDMDREFENEE